MALLDLGPFQSREALPNISAAGPTPGDVDTVEGRGLVFTTLESPPMVQACEADDDVDQQEGSNNTESGSHGRALSPTTRSLPARSGFDHLGDGMGMGEPCLCNVAATNRT